MKDAIKKQADEMAAKGSEIVEKVKSGAGLMNEKVTTTIKELIAKANSLLEQGKFNEAIAPAQNVLDNYDRDSQEAKGIITKAKEKLKAVAEKAKKQLETALSEETHEELKSAATEKIKNIKDNLSNKLKGFSE